MNDPTVIPWVIVWLGLGLLVVGAVLAIFAIDCPKPNHRATVGAWVMVVGVGLMIGPLVVNGAVMLERAFCAAAQKAVAPARP